MKGPKHNLKIAQTFFSFLRVNYQKKQMITVKTINFPEFLVHSAHTVHVNFSANLKFMFIEFMNSQFIFMSSWRCRFYNNGFMNILNQIYAFI